MSVAGPDKPARDGWARSVALTWLKALGVLGLICAVYIVTRHGYSISDVFLLRQDLPVAFSCAALIAVVALSSLRLPAPALAFLDRLVERQGLAIVLAAALLVAGGAFAGWWLVYQTYPLSLDEFWAAFDARIFGSGRFLAPVAAQWRAYVPALEPMWRLEIPGAQAWASTYLPVNAAFRGLFGLIGSQALSGPFWAAMSILLVYVLARQFWPARRDAAFVAGILLATSSQLIVTAMSPYAMSAHLALNLAWLWLFLRKGPLAMCAALVVAFAATGLHQFIFHPLFAGPFILQLWFQRRWRPAVIYTLAYAAIGLFWVSWWPVLFALQGLPAGAAHAAAAGASAEALAMAFNPIGVNLMAENLLRLVLWQNPLTVPLAMIGALVAWRDRNPVMLPMAAGIILTVLFLVVITPFQGHGWGYRYLHGYLGSLCLLAALAWISLTGAADETGRARGWACLAVTSLAAVGLWLPIRLKEAHEFIQPYARSWAAIEHAHADVVIVDASGLWYANDLVRNDPFLEQGPKIMHRYLLSDTQLKALCARYRVAYFDRRDGVRYGITPVLGETSFAGQKALSPLAGRGRLQPPDCARPVTAP